MQYEFSELSPAERYKLLVNTITPRPIAWVVTQDSLGRTNAAPYSFFNAMGADPALVVLGIAGDNARAGEAQKDSLRVIRETGEFTIALVTEADAEIMVMTAINAPAGTSELEFAGVRTRPARHVKPPVIASSPVTFECRVWKLIDTSETSAIVIGEVITMDIVDSVLSEEDGKLRIDAPALNLVGRAHGAGNYWRGTDQIVIDRKSWPDEIV